MESINQLYALASKYEIKSHMEKATEELKDKSLNDIQVATALTWCGRACAAAKMKNESDATEYAHEAIEHAALSGHDDLLKFVKRCLEKHNIDIFK